MSRDLYNGLCRYHLFADALIKLMHQWCTQSIVQGDTAMVGQLNTLISALYNANTHIAWQREIIRANSSDAPPESNRPDAATSMNLNIPEAFRHLTETERAIDVVREYIGSRANTPYVPSELWLKCSRMLLGAKISANLADIRATLLTIN